MNAPSITRILIFSVAVPCVVLAQDTNSPSLSRTKEAAEGVKSSMISEFKCNEEPLDTLLVRLSKLSGVGIKLNKDSFNGKAVPAVTLPALKGFRLENILNTVTAVSGTKWGVTGSYVEVSTP